MKTEGLLKDVPKEWVVFGTIILLTLPRFHGSKIQEGILGNSALVVLESLSTIVIGRVTPTFPIRILLEICCSIGHASTQHLFYLRIILILLK